MVGLGGADYLYGGSGRDVIVASTTTKAPQTGGGEGEEFDPIEALGYCQDALRFWSDDADLDATIEILGEFCVSDGAKDRIYRGGGRGNLIYASQLDVDFENALERSPCNDVLKRDDPDAADGSEGDD